MNMNVYMVIKKDESGRTYETCVPEKELANFLIGTFKMTNHQLIAVIRL